jgi:hypothetical protein
MDFFYFQYICNRNGDLRYKGCEVGTLTLLPWFLALKIIFCSCFTHERALASESARR